MARKKFAALCRFPVLLNIINKYLHDRNKCEIIFTHNRQYHSIGFYNISNDTKGTVFFLDGFKTNEPKQFIRLKLNNKEISENNDTVKVLMCNGHFPDHEPLLKPYLIHRF